MKKNKKTAYISKNFPKFLLIMIVLLSSLVGLYGRYFFNPSGLIRKCPVSWMSGGGMPSFGDNVSYGYPDKMNFPDGSIVYHADKKVDIKWVENNCEVSKPEIAPV